MISVGGAVPHVGASSSGNRPGSFDAPGIEVDDRYAAGPVCMTMDQIGAPVGDIKPPSVPAGIQAMRSHAGGNKADQFEALTVDLVHAVGHHVGNVENASIRRYSDILWHALSGQFEIAQHLSVGHVDFGQAAAIFTSENRVAPSDHKVGVIDPAATRNA